MTVVVKKGISRSKFDEILKKLKRKKRFDYKRHLGKVKWNKDPLEFQKEVRG